MRSPLMGDAPCSGQLELLVISLVRLWALTQRLKHVGLPQWFNLVKFTNYLHKAVSI